MNANWEIDLDTLSRWRHFVDRNLDNPLVIERKRRNVMRVGIDLSRGRIWQVLVGCQVTTQQRSGPGSVVDRFLRSEHWLLDLAACSSKADFRDACQRGLAELGCRRSITIAVNLSAILQALESGGWDSLKPHLNALDAKPDHALEQVAVAHLLGRGFPGMGQKQARNFLQWLGLSLFEIPVDSRVIKVMRSMGASFAPAANALADEQVYRFVQHGLQRLAAALDVYPCVLDACIFSSLDVALDETTRGATKTA